MDRFYRYARLPSCRLAVNAQHGGAWWSAIRQRPVSLDSYAGDSEAERHGLITKTNIKTENGKFEPAAESDCRIDAALDIRGWKELTIIARYRYDALGTSTSYGFMPVVQGLFWGNSAFRPCISDRRLLSLTANFAGTGIFNQEAAIPAAQSAPGVWHIMKTTFRPGSGLVFMIDGVIIFFDPLDGATGIGTVAGTNNNNVRLNLLLTSATTAKYGALDWALVFDKALSETELAAIE